MEQPRIWVDADSCPPAIRTTIIQEAARRALTVTFAANRSIPLGTESPLVHMHVCAATHGAADDYLAGQCAAGDIAVTRDLPLAARLLEKGAAVLNDRGTRFTAQNLAHLLKERELSLEMQRLGIATGGRMRTFGKKEAAAFADCLRAALAERLSNPVKGTN